MASQPHLLTLSILSLLPEHSLLPDDSLGPLFLHLSSTSIFFSLSGIHETEHFILLFFCGLFEV